MMAKDPFASLSERQKECLRLYHAGLQIKQIATMLGIAPSTVNARLERARRTLGATSSREAARLLALHEGSESIWIPPTDSWNPIANSPDSLPDAANASTADGQEEADEADDVADAHQRDSAMWHHPPIRWPFSTAGRTENDIAPSLRLAWVPPAALASLVILALLVLLGVAVQDVLASAHQGLARIF